MNRKCTKFYIYEGKKSIKIEIENVQNLKSMKNLKTIIYKKKIAYLLFDFKPETELSKPNRMEVGSPFNDDAALLRLY